MTPLALIMIRAVLFYLLEYVPDYWRRRWLRFRWQRYPVDHTDATGITGYWALGSWKVAELTEQGKPRFNVGDD